MKKDRQNTILKLIESKPIETQEDLQQELLQLGFNVTQATVSRDLKELPIVKMLDSNGIYRYAVNNHNTNGKKFKYNEIFSNSVVSVCFSMNNVVIKCHSGMAQGACAALDMMKCDNVLGTLAGDDTIFVITKTEKDAEILCTTIENLI